MKKQSKVSLQNSGNMEHKNEIVSTRVGGFGSSDAKMVASIGRNHTLTNTAKKRIAVMRDLLHPNDSITSKAIEVGNEIERIIYESIKLINSKAISNPYRKESSLSAELGFDIFCHPDIAIENHDLGYILWHEVKSTKLTFEETISEYRYQLAWQFMIARSLTERMPIMKLVHYDTSQGYDRFNHSKITIKELFIFDFKYEIEEIKAGLNYIKSILPEFSIETIENYPACVNNLAEQLSLILAESKAMENREKDLREKLKNAMRENNIMSFDNDYFHATYQQEGTQSRFDVDAFRKDNSDMAKIYMKKISIPDQLKIKIK